MEKEKIVVVSTVNTKVSNYLNRLEKSGEIVLKKTDDSIVDLFIKLNNSDDTNEGMNSNALMAFLQEDKNRADAAEKAQRLMSTLCKYFKIPLEKITGVFIRVSDVAHATTLSNKEAADLLTYLERFGFLVFTKRHLFVFTAPTENFQKVIDLEMGKAVSNMILALMPAINYYKANNLEAPAKLLKMVTDLESYLTAE